MIRRLFLVSLILTVVPAAASELATGGGAGQVLSKKTKQAACEARVESPLCQKFSGQPGLLTPQQCSTQASFDPMTLMNGLGSCANGIKMSLWDTAKFMWDSVKFIATAPIKTVGGIYSYLTDGNTRASSHEEVRSAVRDAGDYLNSIYPYIVTEYKKSYDSVGPPWNVTETSRNMAAAAKMGGNLVKGLLGAAWGVIKGKYQEIECFDQKTQIEYACRFAGRIFLPPAAFYGLIRSGVNGLSQMPALTTALEQTFKQGIKARGYMNNAVEAREALRDLGESGRDYINQHNRGK